MQSYNELEQCKQVPPSFESEELTEINQSLIMQLTDAQHSIKQLEGEKSKQLSIMDTIITKNDELMAENKALRG